MNRKTLYALIGLGAAGAGVAAAYRYRDCLPSINREAINETRRSLGTLRRKLDRLERISHECSELLDGCETGQDFFERAESLLRVVRQVVETVEINDSPGPSSEGFSSSMNVEQDSHSDSPE